MTSAWKFINIDDDNFKGYVVGRISTQEIRVFAMFSAALLLTGFAYLYTHAGDTALALASTMSALAFICAIVLEAQER